MIVHSSLPVFQTQDIRASALRQAIDQHCWYPAARRCGCGLNLSSAQLWTEHIATISVYGEPARV